MNPLVYRSVIVTNRYKRVYHTRNCFGYWRKTTEDKKVPIELLSARSNEANLWRLISGYHEYGHRAAKTDPLKTPQDIYNLPQLLPEYYGLNTTDQLYSTNGILLNYTKPKESMGRIIDYLNTIYCGPVTIETRQISDEYEREWFINKYESIITQTIPPDRRASLGELLLKCQTLDNFLAKKFGTLKRYGAEGAESMMGFFDQAFQMASQGGISDVILCMPHRGRLNLLTGLLKLPPELLFHKIRGNSEFPNGSLATGDVISHLASSIDINDSNGNSIHVTMLQNPSHLEAINPVAMGKARARMLSKQTGPYSKEQNEQSKILTIQVHGDGAVSGQGVVMETFAMTRVPHYEIGGSLHLIVNNSLGFTAPTDIGRSSSYCSDVAKMVDCPVIHVNGDHPEEVVKACQVAMEYILEFDKDVIVVMNCFRRWGHNELDNPSITQPVMYKQINSRSSVPDNYWQELLNAGVVDDTKNPSEKKYEELNTCLKAADNYTPSGRDLHGNWNTLQHPSNTLTYWDTGLQEDVLKYIGAKSVETPKDFSVHSRLLKSHIKDRLIKIDQGTSIDWSTAEAMAVGSLLYQGYNVRISGQDVGRGTFSHRHMMLVDQDDDQSYIPLNNITDTQTTHLEIANSHLSEEAVLGFEYGYSIESPKHLVIWEAQFGDFFNGAQIMIDAFISSGEAKWLLQSGLVMLLPHGYDGAGPEHSSCRIERFLQMCNSIDDGYDDDNVNMHITHPTTPAQYYHLLRRQMLRNFRKPLIVQSPKSLLRLPAAVSSLSDMSPGTSFQHVIGDNTIQNKHDVTKVIICSGKHYYALDKHRIENQITNTAIIRLELLCPFPSGSIYKELTKYSNAKEFIWSQEEPANMGPWSFVEPRFRKQLGIQLKRVSRIPYGPPATGISNIYQQEVKKLLLDTFQ